MAARVAAARRAARKAIRVSGTRAADTSSPRGSGGGPLRQIIRVIPSWLWLLIGVLAALTALFFGRSFIERRRARRLERQRQELERHREELLSDVGVLQSALLPEVPPRIGPLEASVAYRPADGPAAGGDFYDVFEMEGDRVAIIVGDVCGHGRQALAVTALMRYSLRAYLQAGGGDPRIALQIAARALENEPHAELTTVVLAVYDARRGTLTYACAGHEPPILLGPAAHKPVTVGASPPIGAGLDTGLRETCVPLPPGTTACFFTDGLVEARLGDGLLGRKRLAELATELGSHGSADELLDRIADRADRASDDMAACIIRTTDDARAATGPRMEDLELDELPGEEERITAFLEACGMPKSKVAPTLRRARTTVGEFGGAILRVSLENGRGTSEVLPRPPSTPIVPVAAVVDRAASAFPAV
ncbi:MAG: serine/threonine-protein phosphatase [Actinobacteria bacterium]|nr:serine/threonine-protein phosphatase [Actinomycetota bacterium]